MFIILAEIKTEEWKGIVYISLHGIISYKIELELELELSLLTN